MSAISSEATRRSQATLRAAQGLAFAASPAFALMALVAANDAPMALCSAASAKPMSGMTAMYLLMSFFHLSPWLKLASSRR